MDRGPGLRARATAAGVLLLRAAGGATDRNASPLATVTPTTTTAATPTTNTSPATASTPAATTSVAPPPGKNPAGLKRARFGNPTESDCILPDPVGEACHLMQSYCVSGRSGANPGRPAYDWYRPIRRDVVAARRGWAVEMRDSNPDSGRGCAMESRVHIEHTDGSVAFYAHLMHQGVDVESGQRVGQGERIAASGNPGNT